MQARNVETQSLPPPPGIIGSLRAGFDVIAGHITVILMPLALDLLLWLGPHVSMAQIAQPVFKDIGTMAASGGLKPDDINSALDMYKQFFQQFNLLGVVRTFPVGISSLMSGRMPTQSPLGAPALLQVDSAYQLLGLIFLLTLAGWIFGGLYFHWVAALVSPTAPAEDPPVTFSAGRAVLQTLIYSLIWCILSWMVGLPLVLLIYVLFAINTLVGEGALLFLGFFSMWLIVPIFFSPHGIFVRKQNAFASILGSFQLARFTLPTSSLFVLTVFLIGIGLNFLWSVPTNNSWLAIIGLFGHAFITTALLASSFIYYHDMTVWLQMVLARLRSNLPAKQA